MLFTVSAVADILILAMVALFLQHVLVTKIRGTFFLLDPLMFFWAGVFVIYINEPLSNFDFYTSRYGYENVVDALVWVVAGLMFLHVGYSLPTGRRLANLLPALPARIQPRRMFFAALMLTGIGTIGWWMQIESVGSLALWAATPRGGENWEELSPYVAQLSAFLTVGVGLLVLHVELHHRGLLLRLVSWTLLAGLFVFFLYLGSRSRLIGVTLLGLMAWSLPRRKNLSFILLAPISLGFFLLINFQTEYREHFRNFSFNLHEIDLQEAASRIFPSYLTGGTSSKQMSGGTEFSMTVAVVDLVPEHIPYGLGAEFLQLFTQPIPRSVWPEKPYPRGELWSDVHMMAGTSEWLVTHVHRPYIAGPAPGFIASWYYNGGIIGLLVGGILTGICLRTLRGVYDRSRNNESFVIVYLILAPAAFGEAVSHPFNWLYFYPLILIPLVPLLHLLSRSESQRVAPEGKTFYVK